MTHADRGSWLFVHTLEKGKERNAETTTAWKTGYIVLRIRNLFLFIQTTFQTHRGRILKEIINLCYMLYIDWYLNKLKLNTGQCPTDIFGWGMVTNQTMENYNLYPITKGIQVSIFTLPSKQIVGIRNTNLSHILRVILYSLATIEFPLFPRSMALWT